MGARQFSLSKKIAMLILLATLPCFLIMFYTGMEQRNHDIEDAETNVRLLVHSMAEIQREMTGSARELLRILALLPEFQKQDIPGCCGILEDVLAENPEYLNFGLVDLKGDVVAAAVPNVSPNLSDRKHFCDALASGDFVAGEYILSRTGTAAPAFPFAYPILDESGNPQAVLTAIIGLSQFERFHEELIPSPDTILAITDYKGIRLWFFPSKDDTNPVGQPIQASAWERAADSPDSGIFRLEGSDHLSRIYGFEPVRLSPGRKPYMYIWAGIPEDEIIEPVSSRLIRNLTLIFLIILLSLVFSWYYGQHMMVSPIHNLIELTRKISRGEPVEDFQAIERGDEFDTLEGAFREMTQELKDKEARLREETRQMEITLKSIGDGVITINMSGKILLVNRAAENLTGWKRDEAAGKRIEEVFKVNHRVSGAAIDNLIDEIISTGTATFSAGNITLRSRTGKEYGITVSGAPLRDLDERILGVIVVFRDISSQLKMEDELLKMNKLESIGTLAGGIAHDFNNILTVILGNVEMALTDTRVGPATKDLLEEAVKASERAKHLTSQLLTFAKGGEPVKEICSAPELVKESVESVLLNEKYKIRYEIADNLMSLEADCSLFRQVVHNIINNACNVMPDGGTVSITMRNALPEEVRERGLLKSLKYLRIDFTDQGPGITDEVLSRIFDPYFSTDINRSGLGLAISHSIVTRHGGQISGESREGQGTTISVFLPGTVPDAQSSDKDVSDGRPERTARILIMDDEEMVRSILETMLKSQGYEVRLSSDGREAVEIYREAVEKGRIIDLIIMDLTVPGGMGGKEAAEKILALNPDMKIIVSSGYSDDPVMADCGKYGFAGAIKKPYTLNELKKQVSRVLG